MYAFNDRVDRAVLTPITRGYQAVIPGRLRQGVSNFFDNALAPETIANDLLQGEFRRGGRDLARFLINTLVGFGGVFDPASELGLERHAEDFGQTLAVWGVPAGPFLILPLLGPSTVRDTARYPAAWFAAPWRWGDGLSGRAGVRVVQFLDQRSRFLNASDQRDTSALDPYLFTKEAWLQRRAFEIANGSPAESDEAADEELDEALDEALDDLDDF